MTALQENGWKAPRSVLVALASYGTSNDRYLERLIREYRSMPYDIDIVIVSNIDKSALGVECRVGTPNKNPWSLPFAHKKLFAERANKYDLFIYSEDDILITEGNLRAFLDVTAALQQDEVAGFLRIERGQNGEENYPDVHAYFHWDPKSIRSRGRYALAHFTNEHAACYVLTQAQLKKAIGSGGFVVDPHEAKYDLLCTAATDPYTQCGLKKLIPFSNIDDFTVHHLSNKYVGKVGLDASALKDQTEVLIRIAEEKRTPISLFNTETKLPRGLYSKDYYEPVIEEVISAIPKTARNVLSIGCGWGATEISLSKRGFCVSAIPLDPVICGNAAANGVEMIYGDFRSARAHLDMRRFDCILFLNVLHLVGEPAEVLSLFVDLLSAESPIIIQSPNMSSLPVIWRQLRARCFETPRNYASAGAHFSFRGSIAGWCKKAGLTIEKTVGVMHRRAKSMGNLTPRLAGLALASDIVSVTRKR